MLPFEARVQGIVIKQGLTPCRGTDKHTLWSRETKLNQVVQKALKQASKKNPALKQTNDFNKQDSRVEYVCLLSVLAPVLKQDFEGNNYKPLSRGTVGCQRAL